MEEFAPRPARRPLDRAFGRSSSRTGAGRRHYPGAITLTRDEARQGWEAAAPRGQGGRWAAGALLAAVAVGVVVLLATAPGSTPAGVAVEEHTATPTLAVQREVAPAPTLAPTAEEELRGPVRTGRGSFLPVRLSQDLWLCPGSVGVAAYGDPGAGRFYLPNHPAAPASDQPPTECWPTAEAAVAGGYLPAELPEGVEQIGDVYLAPASEELRATCQEAADTLDFTVPCPGLLPHLARTDPCGGQFAVVSGCVLAVDGQQAFVLALGGISPDPRAAGLAIAAVANGTVARETGLLACPALPRDGGGPPSPVEGELECADGPPWSPGFARSSPHVGAVLTRLVLDRTPVAVSLDEALGPVRLRVVAALEPVAPAP